MTTLVHPKDALFSGEKPFPIIPSCEHFAGSEKLIGKALELQDKLGPIFDITCDCEDGAQAGQEKSHAEMIVRLLNSPANKFKMAGARIHDFSHPHWRHVRDGVTYRSPASRAGLTIPLLLSRTRVVPPT